MLARLAGHSGTSHPAHEEDLNLDRHTWLPGPAIASLAGGNEAVFVALSDEVIDRGTGGATHGLSRMTATIRTPGGEVMARTLVRKALRSLSAGRHLALPTSHATGRTGAEKQRRIALGCCRWGLWLAMDWFDQRLKVSELDWTTCSHSLAWRTRSTIDCDARTIASTDHANNYQLSSVREIIVFASLMSASLIRERPRNDAQSARPL